MPHSRYFLLENENSEKKNLAIPRRNLRNKYNPLEETEERFVLKYRLSMDAFVYVLDKISLNEGIRNTYIPPILRLASTLLVLGSGGYQWIAAEDIGIPMNQGSLSLIVSEVAEKIQNLLCPLWIKFPSNTQNQTKEYIYEKYKMPRVIGFIDGTHIFLRRPVENEEMFFNRKGRHSLNVMIICDHQMKITAICPKYGGAAHDAFVWKQSQERNRLQQLWEEGEKNSWLLGDSGYGIEPWLFTPYRNPVTHNEKKFNTIHAKARSCVERCIGVYKGRFRILMEERKSRYSPTKMALFSNACAALHNICIHYKVCIDQTAQDEIVEGDITDNPQLTSCQPHQPSFLKRIGETNRRRVAENM